MGINIIRNSGTNFSQIAAVLGNGRDINGGESTNVNQLLSEVKRAVFKKSSLATCVSHELEYEP